MKSCEKKVHYSFIILRLTNSVYKDRNYILILINAKKEINPIRNLFYCYHNKGKKKLTVLTKTALATILVIDWPLTVTLECHALNEQTDQVC